MQSTEPLDKRLLSPYGPIRLSATHWALPASRLALAGHVDGHTGAMSKTFAHFMTHEVMMPMMEAVRPLADSQPALAGAMQAEIYKLKSWIHTWAMYCASGREMFEFSPGLVEALKQTDVGETKLDGIKAPYRSFYVRFGPQPELGYDYEDQRAYVDGAFFTFFCGERGSDDDSLIICLTMTLANGQGFLTPGPEFVIPGADFHIPVDEAIRNAAKAATAEAERLHAKLMMNPDGPAAHMAESLQTSSAEAAGIVRQAMPLLVNALYYLSDLPRTRTKAGSDTPAELAKKFDSARTPKAANKLRSTFLSDGYAVVRLCGEEFDQSFQERSGGNRIAHWRRGHWRDQRYGAKHALTKRIWIRPVLVNSEHPNPDAPGHLYKVGD